MELNILNAADVKKALPMPLAITAMLSAFSQLSKGEVHMPLRTATNIHSQQATILSMPAYLSESQEASVKIVSIFPNNQNSATINGMVIYIDAISGQPRAILEGASLTAIRTGAVSGLATDLLANKDASVLAIIGSGVQAETQLEAVCCVRNIQKIYIYSRKKENAEKFAAKLQHSNIEVVTEIQHATKQADVICTATSATAPLIKLDDIKPGVHINAVGSYTPQMMELDAQLLAHANIFVDQREAALEEAGEIINAIKHKIINPEVLKELGDLVTKKISGRLNKNQITIFKSVGLAIQDVSAAAAALKNNYGTRINF